MIIQTDSTQWWPPGFSQRDSTRFLQLVQERLHAYGMEFSGTAPVLTASDGRQLFLGNLAVQCARNRKSRWPGIVAEFIGALAGIADLADPLAISPDVVRRSLRLRLFPSSQIPVQKPGAGPTSLEDLLGLILRRPAMPRTQWCLYLRRPGAGQGVIGDHLAGWGIDEEEAFVLARGNTLDGERGQTSKKSGVVSEAGNSMFSHVAVLAIASRFRVESSLFVAVPNRHEALAAVLSPDKSGIDAMAHALSESASRYCSSPHPIHFGGWFVPPGGMGRFGEDAELIELFDDAPFGAPPEVGVALGPKAHEYFGEIR